MSHPSAFKTPEGKTAFLAAYGGAMKLWPVPYEELDLPSRFGTTHVVVSGPKDAPPLVLLHGFGGCAQNWHPFTAELSERHRLIVVDLRGHGHSTNPENKFTHREAASDVFLLLETLRVGHFSAMVIATAFFPLKFL